MILWMLVHNSVEETLETNRTTKTSKAFINDHLTMPRLKIEKKNQVF